MKPVSYFMAFILTVGVFLAGCNSTKTPKAVSPKMTGQWEGQARIIVSWCSQKNFLSMWKSIQMEASAAW
tara:strand:+ start:125 stop:334 length:210 start_codon:yes stop_codon:yes gene_type:complete